MEVATLRIVGAALHRPFEGDNGLVAVAQSSEKLSAGRVEVGIAAEVSLEILGTGNRVQRGQGLLRSVGLSDGDRPVQRQQRGWPPMEQRVVQTNDAQPVGVVEARRGCMKRSNCSMELKVTPALGSVCPAEHGHTTVDTGAIPRSTVLVGQQDR